MIDSTLLVTLVLALVSANILTAAIHTVIEVYNSRKRISDYSDLIESLKAARKEDNANVRVSLSDL